ncbi:DUF4738 domain-containing protein [Bacteroides sp. OttesenSCG-928-D19]|nr:DUF4738 domain-containing protein [Bacteroides sp. OttesenSCG-928-D19]
MKKIFYLSTILYLSVFFVACSSGNKENEKKDDTRVLMESSTDSQGIQRMQVSKVNQTVRLKDKDYQISLVRIPDENLPTVESEVGDMFVDNNITLHITQGGKQVFKQTFTKRDFVSLVGEKFLKKSILEGMVFNKTTPQGLVFAASVSYPQTDLFFPISITISETGKMSMKEQEELEEFFYE